MSTLIKNQKKVFTKTVMDGYLHNSKVDIVVEIRHDDCCGNGHNSFAITGTVYKHGRRSDSAWLMGGCIHDVIEKHFPELSHLIKWHLCSTDGPMHYVANTTYHARDCSHDGKKPGDPVKFLNKVKFGDFPITFTEKRKGFFTWLMDSKNFDDIEVVEVQHPKEPNIYIVLIIRLQSLYLIALVQVANGMMHCLMIKIQLLNFWN